MTQNNKGHQTLLRWHLVENIPVQTSLEGCIEKYDHPGPSVRYDCLACWYLAPGGVDPYDPAPVDQRYGYWVVADEMMAGFKVIGDPPGEVHPGKMTRFGPGKWPNDLQLGWTGAKPGAKLQLGVPLAKAGAYEVSVVLTKNWEQAIVQLYLDGKKFGEPIDLYAPKMAPTPPISLGVHRLDAGEHRLTVEITGANPQAGKSYMFGISQMDFKPVR